MAGDIDLQHTLAQIFRRLTPSDPGLAIPDLLGLRGDIEETTYNAQITKLRITQGEARTSHYA